MPRTAERPVYAPQKTLEQRFLNPLDQEHEDFNRIYKEGQIHVGSAEHAHQMLAGMAKDPSRVLIMGGQLGDEGKGRMVSNQLDTLFQLDKIKKVHVVRFQGGNNAGHTVQKDGNTLALHVVPSGVFYEQAVGIIDKEVVVNAEDLQVEVGYVEKTVGDIRNKLILSSQAIHNTDLERTMEWFNQTRTENAGGGTSRGIAPAYAGQLDRTGVRISDFMKPDWREEYGKRYDFLATTLTAHGYTLSDVDVPDFAGTIRSEKGEAVKRKVGSKEEFLDRLEEARSWLLGRDMIKDTYLLHHKTMNDITTGIMAEGAQSIGLHPKVGTFPDVTTSDTTAYGVRDGTGIFMIDQFQQRMAIIKPYQSSVGRRVMPSHIDLKKVDSDHPTKDQQIGLWIRDEAHEYGTTTGRPRDINHMDLPFLTYNLRVGGANSIGMTHLDISREDMPVKVVTHYTDKRTGEVVPYKPDLDYLKTIEAQYRELPGWDGQACRNATSFDTLPENAQKYLSYIQARTGVAIVAVTTGPDERNFLELPGNKPERYPRKKRAA